MDQLYKQLLTDFLQFKSISTDALCASEIVKTAAWLKKIFEQHGFSVNSIGGYDNPIIVASYVANPAYKTCLVYGHYDVQPASQDEGWASDPFTFSQRSGRLYGRGVIDNKGQVLVHMVNVFKAIENKTLGYNVKFMLEGNEETGSPCMEKCIHDKKDLLACDFALISDGEISGGKANIEVGFRGGFNAELTVVTSTTDVHSGIYGHSIPNAVHELTKVFAGLYDAQNRIAIPGFYESVDLISESILAQNKKVHFSLDEHKRISGAKTVLLQPGVDFYTQVGLLPAIECTGIVGGYVAQGFKNSIPAKASAKINFRLVKSQDPKKIAELFRAYVRSIVPEYVDFSFEMVYPYEGVKLDINNPYVQKAKTILAQTHGGEPVLKYVGGGLPIITYFDQILHVPAVSVPLVNEDCAMHAANENFDLAYWDKAMAFSKQFFAKEKN